MKLSEKFQRLESLGFKTPKWAMATKEELKSLCKDFEATRNEYDTDADGVVLSVDSEEELEDLGRSSDRIKPEGQIAYKWVPDTVSVVIKDVEFSQLGGNSITMIAIFDPIELDGAQISRASLKSYRWVQENCVGIGSLVELKRSGSCIPCILKVISNAGATPINYPKVCPICGAPVSFEEANMQCTNFNCQAKEASRIVTFLAAARIKGIGPAVALDYVKAGIKLIDFVAKDWNKIRSLVSQNALSIKIWDKVQMQF